VSEGYGGGRADVQQAMKRATRTERPTRRTRPVPEQAPEGLTRARPAAATAPAPAQSRGRVKINFGDSPVLPVGMIAIGMYLAWFGVHYWMSDVKYPTDPIKSVLQNKGLPPATKTPSDSEQAVLKAAGNQLAGAQGVTPGTGQANPNVVGQAVAAGAAPNQATGKLLAAAYGWNTGQQWADLVSLWDRESGWSNTADTRVTHAGGDASNAAVFAYGIPQARPYNKMPQPAWPPDKGGKADPTAQITWGLAYIKATYGSPSAAWANETAKGFY
jgi:hypothetical protein